jgi:hypothetical protein
MVGCILCLLICCLTMPVTWRLCFPPFPAVRAAAPIDAVVPDATFDSWGLV